MQNIYVSAPQPPPPPPTSPPPHLHPRPHPPPPPAMTSLRNFWLPISLFWLPLLQSHGSPVEEEDVTITSTISHHYHSDTLLSPISLFNVKTLPILLNCEAYKPIWDLIIMHNAFGIQIYALRRTNLPFMCENLG